MIEEDDYRAYDGDPRAERNGVWVDLCPNCSRDEWVIHTNDRGGMVCDHCGFTRDGILLNQMSTSDRRLLRAWGEHDKTETIRDVSTAGVQAYSSKRSTRQRYKHMEYFLERIDQWAMQETAVPADDWETFLCAFHDWCLRKGFRYIIPTREQLYSHIGRIPGTVYTTKEDIRDILVECQNRCPLKFPADGSDPVANKFCRKYLEKWLSIRYRLCGVKSTFSECPAWLIEALKEYFPMVVTAFMRLIHDRTGRKRMIGYNFVFRRLLDLFGFTFCCVDFPVKDTKASKTYIIHWKIICKYYQWPYINSDYNGGGF